jgi:hypothetical protein
MTTQISTSVSPRTRRQADDLIKHAGFTTMSNLLTVAIDHLYQAEMPSDAQRLRNGATDVPCAECGNPIDPTSTWHPGPYSEAYCAACSQPEGQ